MPHILLDRVMLVAMLMLISGRSLMMSGSDLSGRPVGLGHVTVPARQAATVMMTDTSQRRLSRGQIKPSPYSCTAQCAWRPHLDRSSC